MAKFFIDRPIFAWVLAIIIMLAGALSILKLPIEQYPNVAPPAIEIQATYPGADENTAGFGDPGHRTKHERYRWTDVYVLEQ